MYSVTDTLAGGLPHSDIRGSTIARISPRLFAACHVLHRLLVPRHPPNALLTLEIQSRPRHAQDPSTHPAGACAGKPRTGQPALSTQHNQRAHEHLEPRSGPLASHKEKPRLRSDGYDRGSAHAPPEPSSTVKHHARTGSGMIRPANRTGWRNPKPPRRVKPRHGDGRDRTDDPLLAKQVLSR